MKEELNKIIKELKEVLTENKLNITNSELLDLSLRIYITESIGKQKQFYPKPNPYPCPSSTPKLNNKLEPKEKDGLATPQQIYALKKAGIDVKDNISKKEAFNLIKELKNGIRARS